MGVTRLIIWSYAGAWAARRCFRLLSSDLQVVASEGVSPTETRTGSEREKADEVIDLAEYVGGQTVETCSRVTYTPPKHSTLRNAVPWRAGEIVDGGRGKPLLEAPTFQRPWPYENSVRFC